MSVYEMIGKKIKEYGVEKFEVLSNKEKDNLVRVFAIELLKEQEATK